MTIKTAKPEPTAQLPQDDPEMGDTSAVRRDGRTLQPFVARFAHSVARIVNHADNLQKGYKNKNHHHHDERSDMQIQQAERVFHYSEGLVLPDPDPSLGIEAVRQVYASSYPEIITAAVSGPELVAGKQVFTFKTAVGTKS